jgi:hypothetical protein
LFFFCKNFHKNFRHFRQFSWAISTKYFHVNFRKNVETQIFVLALLSRYHIFFGGGGPLKCNKGVCAGKLKIGGWFGTKSNLGSSVAKTVLMLLSVKIPTCQSS